MSSSVRASGLKTHSRGPRSPYAMKRDVRPRPMLAPSRCHPTLHTAPPAPTMCCRTEPSSASHSQMSSSFPPVEATVIPSGEKTDEYTVFVCSPNVDRRIPSERRHTEASGEPGPKPVVVARRDPSPSKATLSTSLDCFSKVLSYSPVVPSHSRTVLSSLPDAIWSPSGAYATHPTSAPCPSMTRMHLPVVVSHNRRVPSRLAVTRHAPVGEKAIP